MSMHLFDLYILIIYIKTIISAAWFKKKHKFAAIFCICMVLYGMYSIFYVKMHLIQRNIKIQLIWIQINTRDILRNMTMVIYSTR